MINEQVKKQLEYLKSLVDAEIKDEKQCNEWNIPYIPSRRKYENMQDYEEYKKEIEKNGDKNLLIMVKLSGDGGINMFGIYPFARRYTKMCYGDYLLKHTTKFGTDILVRESEVNIIK